MEIRRQGSRAADRLKLLRRQGSAWESAAPWSHGFWRAPICAEPGAGGIRTGGHSVQFRLDPVHLLHAVYRTATVLTAGKCRAANEPGARSEASRREGGHPSLTESGHGEHRAAVGSIPMLCCCSPIARGGTQKARPNADASEAGFRYGFAYIVCSTKCMTNRSEMI